MPVILLHGIGSMAESWMPLVEALEESSSIFAWDMPGYGASAALGVPRPCADSYANALDTMLELAEIESAIIIGHSLGALIAGRFAASRPEKIAGLALLSPALGYDVPAGHPLPAKVQARINDLDRLGPERFAAARAANLVYAPSDNPALVQQIRNAMAHVRQPGYGDAVQALASGDLLSDIRIIAAPGIVATGADDAVTPPSGARLVHANLRHAGVFFEVPETGHALPQQAAPQTARLLQDFFDDINESHS